MKNYTIQELKENAFSISQDQHYNIQLDASDIEKLKTELPTLLLELDGQEAEFKEYKKKTSEIIKIKKTRVKSIYNGIELGEMESSGDVYNIQNFEENKMEMFTSEGIYIGSRDLEEGEYQTKI